MELHDDDLFGFEAHGAAPLPIATTQGFTDHDGVRMWCATYGSGAPVILLHGGLGNGGYQVPALVDFGRRVVLIDRRGHGRSTRDLRRFTYEMMASDERQRQCLVRIGHFTVDLPASASPASTAPADLL